MRYIIIFTLYILGSVQYIVAPPVTQKKKEGESENNVDSYGQLENFGIEYNRYLKEVVSALESDPEFREKLEKAEEVDIRTGKIAHELEYVNHNVRTKLDELKRQELERLRHLAMKEHELRNGLDTEHLKILPEHLDHSNPHTFEIEDLRKLIAKTTADLAEADRKRRAEFKEYEMQKEFEKQEKLKNLDEEHRKQYQKQLEELEQKHKKHEPLHHPGSKQQLEEVWEKQDHMENQDFDPKTFFHLHDLDGNGVWDEAEVKALFLKELDKLYTAGAPEDDMRERIEEMERMREHVFSEADTNKDGLISFEEFLAQTQKPDFEKDQGWEGLDQQQTFTQEEYQEFERQRHEEIQRMIEQGLIPPHPSGYPPQPPPGYHPNMQQQYPQQGMGQIPQGQPIHPGQYQQAQYVQPQYHHGQQGQFHPNQHQAQGFQQHPSQQNQFHQVAPGQPIQNQVHSGQPIQNQPHPGQPIQNQPHPGQPIQNQPHPGQPVQNQPHPGQPIQNQVHSGQPIQNQPHPGQPAQPIQNQPLSGQPVPPNQPIQNQAHPEQPIYSNQPIQNQAQVNTNEGHAPQIPLNQEQNAVPQNPSPHLDQNVQHNDVKEYVKDAAAAKS